LLLGVAVLCPTLSFAQGRRGTGGGRVRGTGAPVQMDERTVLDLFSAILNLSDSQQQQLHAAFDAAVKTAAPISTQMENNNEAIFEAVKAGKSDDQVKTLAQQQASLSSQMLTLQAQTFSKTWAVLSSDQKARFDDLMYDDIGQFLSNAKLSASPGPASTPTAGGP
jgi:Spy/CpxP family protein refolding chaperone